ncbi:MAG: hypothetical protein KJT01_14145 [Gemmatimonadetes bacterium]|nr:hypothetical protein [Gemmatimonadota bacterium]
MAAGWGWLAIAALVLGAAGCDALVSPPLFGTVSALVTRRDSVTPIAGTRVLLYTGDRPMGYATSDSSGRVLFQDVPEGVYGLRISAPPGYLPLERLYIGPASTEFVHNVRVRPRDSLGVQFTLLKEGRGRVAVQVQDADGRGLADIPLNLYGPQGPLAAARTDAAGRATFEALPLGNYGVFASRPVAFRDSGEAPQVPRDGLIVDEGSTQRAAFTFAPCGGSVVAEVRDQQGRPAPGRVQLYQGTGPLQVVTLPADGMQRFDALLCDVYGVRYLPPPVGWRAAEVRGAAFADGVRVRRTSGTVRVPLVVEKYGWGSIRLRVVDQQGAPVPPIRAVVYNGVTLVADTRLDSAGVLRVDSLRADLQYGARIAPPEPYGYRLVEGRGESFADGLVLQDGVTRDVTLRLQRLPRAAMRVAVVDDAGNPVAGARVVVYIATGLRHDQRTDAAGVTVATDLVAGDEHGARVVPPTGYTVTEARGSSYVDGLVLTGGEVRHVTFRLTRQ